MITNIPGIPMNPSMPVETPRCTHDGKYRLFGAVNGCCACQLEVTQRELIAATKRGDFWRKQASEWDMREADAQTVLEAEQRAEKAEAALEGMKEQTNIPHELVEKLEYGLTLIGVSERARIAEPKEFEALQKWALECQVQLDASREQGRKG